MNTFETKLDAALGQLRQQEPLPRILAEEGN